MIKIIVCFKNKFYLFLETIPMSSLLLSAFSHSSPTHLGFNMYALYTFCRGMQIKYCISLLFLINLLHYRYNPTMGRNVT